MPPPAHPSFPSAPIGPVRARSTTAPTTARCRSTGPGGAQSYECLADDCGYTYHPDRDTGWTADFNVDLDVDHGTAATPTPGKARSGPAPTHPAALARAFDPPGTPETAQPAAAPIHRLARPPERDAQTQSAGASRRR